MNESRSISLSNLRVFRRTAVFFVAFFLCWGTSFFQNPKTDAAATLVQTTNAVANGATSVSVNYTSVATANNLLVVICGASTNTAITGPSGFTSAINQSGTPSQAIFYKVAAGGEQNGIQCSGSNTRWGIHVYEYSGIVTSSPLDATASATGTSTSAASGNITTTNANNLLIAGVTAAANTSVTAWSNSFTGRNAFQNGGQANSRAAYGGADFEVTTTGTYSTAATIGNASWRGQIAGFKVAPTGTLNVDIVDSGGVSIANPSAAFSAATVSYACQQTTATLGVNNARIRLSNTTVNGNWTVTIAATSGATAIWSNGTSSFDYNDPTSSGCSDGADADTRAGQLTINPSASTISPQGGCASTGISRGASSAYSQGVVNAITLLSATGSQTNCFYDLTNVSLTQQIPAETPSDGVSYTLNLTITATAN